MSDVITVDQLRAALEGVPGDVPVAISYDRGYLAEANGVEFTKPDDGVGDNMHITNVPTFIVWTDW